MIKAKLLSCMFLFCLALSALAGPELKVPAEVKGEPGDFIVIKAETEGTKLSYKALDKGLKILPKEIVSDPKVIVVTSVKPGKYRLHVVTAVGGEPSDIMEIIVIIGDPPTPPNPDPPQPEPLDDLAKSFKKAYDADTAVDKRERYVALIEAMKKAVDMTGDASYKTIDELVSAVGRETNSKVATSLIGVRKAIGEYLNKTLPTDDVNLDSGLRATIKGAYLKVVASLEAAK